MLTINEQTLAAAWLSRFGTPLPVLGCEALATKILRDHGVDLGLGAAREQVDSGQGSSPPS